MKIWEPCPDCGKSPWRPGHPNREHDTRIVDLEDLKKYVATGGVEE